MMRAKFRKGIEQVYGSKLDPIHPGKHQAFTVGTTKTSTLRAERAINGPATKRGPRTQRSFVTAQDYYITSNVPVTSTDIRSTHMAQPQTTSTGTGTTTTAYGAATRRGGGSISAAHKTSARQPQVHARSLYTRIEGKVVNNVALNKQKVVNPQVHNDNHSPNQTLCQGHGHGQHMHGKRLTHRVVYANPNIGNTTASDYSEKEPALPPSASSLERRSRIQQQPTQHQLHQQQQMHYDPAQHKQHKHVHKHHHHHDLPLNVSHADELEHNKDTETEEFFELVRRTVQTAIGTSLYDVLNRNFNDLDAKMERFMNLIQLTNEKLGKIKEDITNKVIHYGEENSRHFRYLCMKSEYDKMFYQHQTQIASESQGSSQPIKMEPKSSNYSNISGQGTEYKVKYAPKQMKNKMLNELRKKANPNHNKEGVPMQSPCVCHSTSNAMHPKAEPHNLYSQPSIGGIKSSEMGLREVLGHLQRFCDPNADQSKLNPKEMMTNLENIMSTVGTAKSSATVQSAASLLSEGCTSARKFTKARQELESSVDTADGEEADTETEAFQYSSDGMTSRSDDSDVAYPTGAMTARLSSQSSHRSNIGAGDC